jgi:hypothetical protein
VRGQGLGNLVLQGKMTGPDQNGLGRLVSTALELSLRHPNLHYFRQSFEP